MNAGRSCPIAYRYGANALARTSTTRADTLYVIGGLYGNPFALRTLIDMAAREEGPVRLCFNGDFNWFNVDDAGFRAINECVLQHDAIVGNVEYVETGSGQQRRGGRVGLEGEGPERVRSGRER